MQKTKNLYLCDGNEACSDIAYRLSDIAVIYPITPSSPMAENYEAWSTKGKKNIFDRQPETAMMQSEAGAIAAVHGVLSAGALVTTFTSSQGLLLMIPNMFKIAGELTPFTMHIAARSVAAHALSIFGDHSDVMSCRQTGFAMLISGCVQEAHDFAAIAHSSSLKSRIPFMHFFDGFRTSHEISAILRLSDDALKNLMDENEIRAFQNRTLNPNAPTIQGTSQNPDVFFQAREAVNPYYAAVINIVKEKFAALQKETGRKYSVVEYAGAPDAKNIIVLMGSGAQTAQETALYLNSKGEKLGVLKINLYRPFPAAAFCAAIPQTVEKIAVLEKTKESGSVGEPLYLDVCACLSEENRKNIEVIGGRYGLSSKDFTPADVKAVFDELKSKNPKREFTVGITDDVSKLSLPADNSFEILDDVQEALFYGLGSDGTVGANKNSIKIISQYGGKFGQGYFEYDSKKSGAITISHLRFSDNPIKAPYLISKAGFIGVSHFPIFNSHDVLSKVKDGAVLLINAPFKKDELWKNLPLEAQRGIVDKKIKVYAIDANDLAWKIGMGRRANTIMQICFFKIAEILDIEIALKAVKESIEKTYSSKGQNIVDMNLKAVDEALKHLYEVDVPACIDQDARHIPPSLSGENIPPFARDVLAAISAGKGNELPVSAMPPDGRFPTATSQYEKFKIALEVPVWDPSLCIQCGRCSLFCPHASIRTKVIGREKLQGAPSTFKSMDLKAADLGENLSFIVQVSPKDCRGCGICVKNCPGISKTDKGQKAIKMTPIDSVLETENTNWSFFNELPHIDRTKLDFSKPQHSQLAQPLFEFSGACAGCGETPYIKLITQLFGDRMIIANATGCSSIYGGNLPTTPYCKDANGRGPAWSNSLFEDNAEFGYGMRLAIDKKTETARALLKGLIGNVGADGKAPAKTASGLIGRIDENLAIALLDNKQESELEIDMQRKNIALLKEALASLKTDEAQSLKDYLDYLLKKSVWLIGGDGWAYDIGYGGLDHVVNMRRNVNILVLDTEVYSNTGGQESKATPFGATAKFASLGRSGHKKDLAQIIMAGGNAYVARIALGANPSQALKALQEAQAFEGPSVIIAYCPCIAHGYDLINAVDQESLAVKSGYWDLFRFDPRLIKEGKAGLQVDSQMAPNAKELLKEYLGRELRFRGSSFGIEQLVDIKMEEIKRRHLML